MFSKVLRKSTTACSDNIQRLRAALDGADAVAVGAGAGLSASAGPTYSGERFEKHFGDFAEKYGIRDMYSGRFYPFESLEEKWAWWSRHILVNRYERAPKPVYDDLLELVRDKDYFVLTTNVDHQFQLAGFDKMSRFSTQVDCGLWQCSKPCRQETYDNEDTVRRIIAEQRDMKTPSELIPRCPKCGRPQTPNLRCDDTFVEDTGRHRCGRMVYLEKGVGTGTPVTVKFPLWKYTHENPDAIFARVNLRDGCRAKRNCWALNLCGRRHWNRSQAIGV